MGMKRSEAEKLIKYAQSKNDGPWIRHSYHVAKLAEKIALLGNMDGEWAYCFGLCHDIGRMNGAMQARHSIEGYRYLLEQGYPDEARICMTHTFQYQDVDAIYDHWDCGDEDYQFVKEYLESVTYDEYDKLIQLCDALSLADGYCYAEKKMVSSILKFGFKNTTVEKWKAILALKQHFDDVTGMDIYTLLK